MPLPESTALENTCVLETPSTLVNAAFRFAKDNIARSIRWYTLGWGVGSAPHRHSIVVGREVGWVCPGADYVAPWFAPAALAIFRDRQKPNGQIVEAVDMESGKTEEDGLNATDSTPLYILAVVQRYRHYPNPFYREAFLPSIRRAADHLIAEIGPNGLIVSRASNSSRSASWRNEAGIAINGEVTEVNALSAHALRLAAEFTGESAYREAGDKIAEAIESRLWDEALGGYSLSRDPATDQRDSSVTGDMLFPVLCGIASTERADRVLERLARPDFQTPRGMRTLPKGDAAYQPEGAKGQSGGISPNLTLWYAASVAGIDPKRALDAIERVARPVALEREALEAKSTPGEFAEYFDGDSGFRLGTSLSPWVAPTFLCAVLEGLLGLTWVQGQPRFHPNWPDGWDEVTIRALPTGDGAMDITLRRGEEFSPLSSDEEAEEEVVDNA